METELGYSWYLEFPEYDVAFESQHLYSTAKAAWNSGRAKLEELGRDKPYPDLAYLQVRAEPSGKFVRGNMLQPERPSLSRLDNILWSLGSGEDPKDCWTPEDDEKMVWREAEVR